MTSYDKMSKKAKREVNNAKRNVWACNPVTRKSESPRAYNRAKAKREAFR